MGAGSTINSNTGDVKKLKMYQKGFNQIDLGGDQKVFGSLYAETANIKIGAGGGFHRDIFSGGTKVTVDGGARVNSQLFLVPNAKFTLSGGGSVTYTESDSELIPGGSIKDYGDGSDLVENTSTIEK